MTATTHFETTNSSNYWLLHFGASVMLIIVAGAYLSIQLMQYGHAAFNTTNYGVFWGLPIVTYDYFLLTSTGLVMLAGAWYLLGWETFRPAARTALWLGLVAILGGVVVLVLELGNPWIAIYAVPLNLQTSSPLFWKVLLVAVYMLALSLALLGTIVDNGRKFTSLFAKMAAILALAITLVAGLVYGMMAMRPIWFSGEVPVVFLIESLVGGVAFVMFFAHLPVRFRHDTLGAERQRLFAGPLPLLFAALIALYLILHMGRAVTGYWTNAEGFQVWRHILAGPLFWIGVLGCGVLPLMLMLLPGTRVRSEIQMLSGLLIMVGLFIGRYEFIIGGQQVPLFKGSWQQGLIEYIPSAAEWALLALGVGVANAVYAFAAWKFGADQE